MDEHKYWTVASRPTTDVERDNFQLQSGAVPVPGQGEMLIRVEWLVLTPPLRMALTSGGITRSPIPIGDVMRGTGLGRVIASNAAGFTEGELVTGNMGWQTHLVSDGTGISHAGSSHGLPDTTLLHVLGAGGATAYIGLSEYGQPRPGDTLVVSAAAGNVGSIVCQLGRLQGCRVVGIAGSDRKCAWLTETLGCTAAINYKTQDVSAALDEACPHGIDIYFDNVGGEVLDACLERVARDGRIVLCGGTSQYNNDLDWYGPKHYFNLVYKQATMSGFYIYNFTHQFRSVHRRLAALLKAKELTYAEDVTEGLDSAPDALIRVLNGDNFGVQLVRVAD